MAENTIESRARSFRSFFSFVFILIVMAISVTSLIQQGGESDVDLTDLGDVAVLDEFWVLISAALVFFMQAGFLCYEVGLARPEHTTPVALKNIVDWAISTCAFVLIGFALMFGTSSTGFFGTSFFALDGLFEAATTVTGPTFFLFQLAFAGTAITLVSGSLVERTTLLAYSGIAVSLGLVIYPVYGHWVWGDLLVEGNEPWLAATGFHDFAGGTVVHLLGATVAIVGIKMIGPRIGRFGPDGEPREMEPSSIGLSLLGTIILWFGWWGFNGGSFLVFDGRVIDAIILTNVAAVAGLIGAALFGYLFQNRFMLSSKMVGGALGGLVAITPGADVMTLRGTLATGLLAGIAVSWTNDFLLRRRIDDALGVIPIHGTAAVVGTITLALFARPGTLDNSLGTQVLVQAAGVGVCIAWAGGVSFPIYWTIRRVIGLRVDPTTELQGATLDNNEWPYAITAVADKDTVSEDGAERERTTTSGGVLVGAERDRD